MPAHIQGEERMERSFRMVAAGCGTVAALIGCFYFISWLTGSMTYAGRAAITMKTNASLCLLLSGIALVMAVPRQPRPWIVWTALLLAFLCTLTAGLTLVEHVTGLDLGIDQLLALELPGAIGITSPNRMGLPGATSFALSGTALITLLLGKGKAIRLVQSIALLLCLLALLGILGYLYHVQKLYGAVKYTAIAWQTAVAILSLGGGLLCARPGEGIMATVTAKDPGGVAVRTLLIPAVLLPITLGWLRLQGEWRGLYESYFGTSILVLSLIIIFSLLVYNTAKRLSSAAAAEKKALEELQRTQAMLLEAANLSRTGAWEYDIVHGLWTLSEEWMRIHGVSQGTLKPDELIEIAHPDDRSAIDEALTALQQGLKPYDTEHRIIRQDTGEVRVVKAKGNYVRDETGRVVRVYGFVQDITAQKRAEEEAQVQRQLLESIVEEMPAGVVMVRGSDFRILLANPAYAKYAPGKEMAGKTMEEVWPEVYAHLGNLFRHVLETGEVYHATDEPFQIRRSPGAPLEERYFTWSLFRVQLPGDQGPGVLATLWETTDRKHGEQTLRESEKKFRAIFQHAALGMGRVSFTGARWIDVNEAFCRMLGYSMEYMLATPWPEITHPEDVDLDLIPFRQMAAGELDTYSVEKRFLHKDGHHVWARLTLSLVRDAEGRPDYEIAVIEDITYRKHAEEALRKAKDELELRVRERTRELEQAYDELKHETGERVAAVENLRKNEQLLIQQSRLAAMGEMLGNIAHQWRQPLNILGLMIQQLPLTHEMGQLTREYLEEHVAKAMRVVLHMSQTINDFRDFLQEEKERKLFNVNNAVATTVSLFEATLKTMDVELELKQSEEIFITGHRNEFSQVLMNIITNARDVFRERKTEDPRLVITIFKEDGNTIVTIADNAGGIPEEIMDRIFEPYFTTKAPDKGTGIGLFMSKNIIEKSMGGTLRVRNVSGGAEFRIELPGS